MANLQPDQAEGLRRLLAPNSLRILTITSGTVGTGKTTTVINLAAALTGNGKNVLVIDENAGASNLVGMLGITARHDLVDVIGADKVFEEAIIVSPGGFRILPAGRWFRVSETLSAGDRACFIKSFACFAESIDVILIDAAPGRTSRSLPLAFPGHEIMALVSPDPTSITATYALIKHVKGNGKNAANVHVLVNKAGTEAEARLIFDNMQSAAKHYLALSLEFTGFIPRDGSLSLGHTVASKLQARSTGAFCRAAELLAQRLSPQPGGNGLEEFAKGLMGSIPEGKSGGSGFAAAQNREPSHV